MAETKPYKKHLPRVDEESRGWWEALARHELYFQRCGSCGTKRLYPRAVCPTCLSSAVEWVRDHAAEYGITRSQYRLEQDIWIAWIKSLGPARARHGAAADITRPSETCGTNSRRRASSTDWLSTHPGIAATESAPRRTTRRATSRHARTSTGWPW